MSGDDVVTQKVAAWTNPLSFSRHLYLHHHNHIFVFLLLEFLFINISVKMQLAASNNTIRSEAPLTVSPKCLPFYPDHLTSSSLFDMCDYFLHIHFQNLPHDFSSPASPCFLIREVKVRRRVRNFTPIISLHYA